MMNILKSILTRKKRIIKPMSLVKYSIQSKLLAFFIILVVFSLSLTLYFSLDLFYKDKSAYIFEASLSKAENDGKLVSDYLSQKVDDAELLAQYVTSHNHVESIKVFLRNRTDILDFSIFAKTENGWKKSEPNSLFVESIRPEAINSFSSIESELLTRFDQVVKNRLVIFFHRDAIPIPVITIAISDKSSSAILVLKVSARKVEELFKSSGSAFKSSLLDHDYNYVFAQESGYAFKEIINPLMNQKVLQGVFDIQIQGRDYLVGFHKIPSLGLATLSVLSKTSAFKVAQSLIFKSLAIGLLIISISLVAGVFVSRSLTKPINQLMDATKRVSSGDFETRVQILSQDEFTVLGRSFNFMCDEIHRYMDEIKDKIRMEDELALAQLVQSSFFPHKDVTLGNLNISGVYQSASECGGDWWGVYEIEGRRIVLIGDATGHGVPAALVTATANCCAQVLKDLSFNRPEILEDPALILAMMNRVIYNLGGKILMTFFIGILDEAGQSLTYSNASHNPPFLYRFSENEPSKEDLNILMEANGTRLGHTLETTYENCRVEFNQHDVLFLYSDGILEAENQKGKQYGERRFLKSLLKVAKNTPQEMTSQILEDAYDYYEDVPPNDDITLVIIKRG